MKRRCEYCSHNPTTANNYAQRCGPPRAARARWLVNRITAPLLLAVIALLAAWPAMADGLPGGCVDSPENPTVVLGIAGSAVVGLSLLWARWRSK
jgi:XrtJ-associated TM-motif-TM protein